MRIVNGNVFVDGEFKHVDLSIEGERFGDVLPFGSVGECAPLDKQVVEADGCYVVPGLIDLHFHGCMGSDMCDGTTDAAARAGHQCPLSLKFKHDDLLLTNKLLFHKCNTYAAALQQEYSPI